ncbi:hypothetical protein GSI_03247 [Ganoderma sinense ZZ0214-1]|uniref:Uncharacterized protein n=1 Tax=Ganoderma sinense ZZ0214-1 TaxID=1077348 RepID=A0A2G8SL38_9APHY|nr:hypothetical protein GSI_03247 [Ganoderma sinense ZZ0214-1]
MSLSVNKPLTETGSASSQGPSQQTPRTPNVTQSLPLALAGHVHVLINHYWQDSSFRPNSPFRRHASKQPGTIMTFFAAWEGPVRWWHKGAPQVRNSDQLGSLLVLTVVVAQGPGSYLDAEYGACITVSDRSDQDIDCIVKKPGAVAGHLERDSQVRFTRSGCLGSGKSVLWTSDCSNSWVQMGEENP